MTPTVLLVFPEKSRGRYIEIKKMRLNVTEKYLDEQRENAEKLR